MYKNKAITFNVNAAVTCIYMLINMLNNEVT